MRPIVSMPDEDRATDIGSMHIGKDRVCSSGDILADRQTDTQTVILITILRKRCRERSNNQNRPIFYTTTNFTRYWVTEVGALSAAGWA